MSATHGTSFKPCGKLIQFDCNMSSNIRILLHEDLTDLMHVSSVPIVLFIVSVQVVPNVSLTCPIIVTKEFCR